MSGGPDETEGRALYRAHADKRARADISMARHPVRMAPSNRIAFSVETDVRILIDRLEGISDRMDAIADTIYPARHHGVTTEAWAAGELRAMAANSRQIVQRIKEDTAARSDDPHKPQDALRELLDAVDAFNDGYSDRVDKTAIHQAREALGRVPRETE